MSLKDAVLRFLDAQRKCGGEYVWDHSFHGREPPPEWNPQTEKYGEYVSVFMKSPCHDRGTYTLPVTHNVGPGDDMCCDDCADFVKKLLGAGAAREGEWAPALREMIELTGWKPKEVDR